MPRRKKIIAKPVTISFAQEMENSPYILNLPEKLSPPPDPALEWQPSDLDLALSQPLKRAKRIKIPRQLEKKIKIPALKINFRPFAILAKKRQQRFRLKSLNWRWPRINLPKIRFPRLKISFPSISLWPSLNLQSWQRALAGFSLAALFLVLPIKALSAYSTLKDSQQNIMESGALAFEQLDAGQKALEEGNFIEASGRLQTSLDLFSQAQSGLNQISPLWRSLLYLTPHLGEKLKNGEELLLAGANLTLGCLPILYLLDSKEQNLSLERLKTTLEQVAPRLAQTNQNLMAVDPQFLPEQNRQTFLKIRQAIYLLSADLQNLNNLAQNIFTAIGKNEEKTYLLIFQNDNEIRPTGGFLGSFAEIKIKNGQIAKLDIPGEGSYKLQGSLRAALVPPAPLQLLQPRWQFQDANWFPDFPASAKKIMWFYEKSGGPTVDGVIAFDTRPLIDLLKITGPIGLPTYNKIITSENFVAELQKQIEIDYDKTQNQPKQILADLAPLLLEKISNGQNKLLPLLTLADRHLSQRHIQLFFTDQNLERQILTQGWGGEVKNNPEGDFISVINTNIAGGKTDQVIKQTILHQTEIQESGDIIDKVTITREHRGDFNDPFTNWQNVDYLRLYAPLGSQLLSTSGFSWPEEKHFKIPEKWYKIDEDLLQIEKNKTIDSRDGTIITEEFGKTVFGNWVLTKPGQTTTVALIYRLPFKMKIAENKNWKTSLKNFLRQDEKYFSYSLLAQKQAGTLADDFIHTISWPAPWRLLWTDPEDLLWQNNQLVYKTTMAEDKFLGLLFQK